MSSALDIIHGLTIGQISGLIAVGVFIGGIYSLCFIEGGLTTPSILLGTFTYLYPAA